MQESASTDCPFSKMESYRGQHRKHGKGSCQPSATKKKRQPTQTQARTIEVLNFHLKADEGISKSDGGVGEQVVVFALEARVFLYSCTTVLERAASE